MANNRKAKPEQCPDFVEGELNSSGSILRRMAEAGELDFLDVVTLPATKKPKAKTKPQETTA